MKRLIDWVKSVVGYHVVVYWEDTIVSHYTWKWSEAVEWMACYPKTGVLCIVYAHTEMIATRG